MPGDRKARTRQAWLGVLEKHRGPMHAPDAADCWSSEYDLASRDRLIAIQNEKLALLTPFLYENSAFYRQRFKRLGLLPTDIRTVDDLPKWPVVTKEEMSLDAAANPPLGTYLTIGDDEWRDRGWMQFSTSGSTGVPRAFRYTHIDRAQWEWTNARALQAMGIKRGETVLPIGGFGPHVWLWGVMSALAAMRVAVIPGGGLDAQARARIIDRFKPSVVACTPSYALYLGHVLQELGLDPAASSVHTLFLGGEPGVSIAATRQRLEGLWHARTVEFYGCTEAAPNAGGFSCEYSTRNPSEPFAHLMEDAQIWETVGANDYSVVAPGERGLTVCTSLSSESSPQLRFLVGDYTRLNHAICECGRSHVRAMGSFADRSDDIINLRGIKFFPSQVEQAIRSVGGVGDEFEIVLSSSDDGMPIMSVRVEHTEHGTPAAIAERISAAIRSHCEVRVGVEVLAPNTLPKSEFKARRVRDLR